MSSGDILADAARKPAEIRAAPFVGLKLLPSPDASAIVVAALGCP